ncbi:MAG: hypothetical protein HYV07_31625 [Deltaproteobacteria bacterium]|nr:hypothetical protein [Deltaproteobacteria bacterium]
MAKARPAITVSVGGLTLSAILACAPSVVQIAMPAEAEYAALVWLTDRDEYRSSTNLIPTDELSRISVDSADHPAGIPLRVVGFRRATLLRTGLSVDALLTSPLRPAGVGVGTFPPPDFEARGAWRDDGIISLTAGPPSTWTAAGFPACPVDPCAYFPIGNRTELDPGPDPPYFEAVLPLDEHTSAAVGESGEVFRIEGTSVRAWTSTTVRLADAARTDDGRAWILADGALLELGADGGLTRRATVRADHRMQSDGSSLFMTSHTQTLEVFDGESVRLLFEAPGQLDPADSDVAVIGRGRAAAAFESGYVVTSGPDGVQPDRAFRNPHAIAFVPGFGIVVSTWVPTEMRRRVDSRWELVVPDLEPTYQIHKLWPLGPGFLFGGYAGSLGSFVPNVGVCGPIDLGPDHIRDLAPHDGGLLMVGKRGLISRTELQLETVPPSCSYE